MLIAIVIIIIIRVIAGLGTKGSVGALRLLEVIQNVARLIESALYLSLSPVSLTFSLGICVLFENLLENRFSLVEFLDVCLGFYKKNESILLLQLLLLLLLSAYFVYKRTVCTQCCVYSRSHCMFSLSWRRLFRILFEVLLKVFVVVEHSLKYFFVLVNFVGIFSLTK